MQAVRVSDSAPPGWYPDASAPGLERWWDGDRWSAVTRPVPVPSAPAPPAAPSGPPAPSSWEQPYPGQYRNGPYEALRKATPDGVPLAGMAARLGARVTDFAAVTVLGLALAFPSVRRVWIAASDWSQRWAARAATGDTTSPDSSELTKDPAFANSMITVTLIVLLVSLVYTVGFITARGATPGKLLAGVRVRPLDREGRPTFGQALLRWLLLDGVTQVLQYVGLLYFVVAALSPLWHPRRQGWHDRVARTVVVSTRYGRP